ncbi:unnamed protein product [Urochloa humidicola]
MEAAPALPDDVLEDVLSRLAPRSHAVSRRVCKTWRGVIDERQLLFRLSHLLPHSVRGLFVNYIDHDRPHFLARPAPGPAADGSPRINGKFSFMAREKSFFWHYILDHCNGLVLNSINEHVGDSEIMYVCNPTTQRWVRLPPHHNYCQRHMQRNTFLVFNPAVSPEQWEILMAPLEPQEKVVKDMELEDWMMQWPPAMWGWSILSSTAMEWEEKVFVREGEAAGNVADLLTHDLDDKYDPRWRYGVYCQGALYVHCHGEFISRQTIPLFFAVSTSIDNLCI